MTYLGDIPEDATLDFKWNSADGSGGSITRATNGTIAVYKANGTTESTAGVTDTEDFDSLTGVHHVRIDTSADAFYAAGEDYQVVLQAATIDGETVNAVLREFSIENRTTFPKADYPTNFAALGIESDGDLTKVNALDGHTAQTGDSFARLGAPAGASVAADIAAVPTAAEVVNEWETQSQADPTGFHVNLLEVSGTPQTPGDIIQTLGDTDANIGNLATAIFTVDNVVDGIQTDLDNGTDGLGALKAAIDGLNDPTAAAIAAAVRDVDNTSPAADSLGEAINSASAPTVEQIDAELSANHGNGSWESGGLGSGARTVTITVDDGTDPLEAARVRFTKAAESYVGSTNASGEIVFSLDDGTWAVAISLAGYQFTPTTLLVNGDETQTYSMTAHSFTSSEPGQTTGFLVVYDEEGDIEADATISIVAEIAGSADGQAYDSATRTATSDSNGLVQFPNLFKGVTYRLFRGDGQGLRVTIPTGAGATYELPSIVGEDA